MKSKKILFSLFLILLFSFLGFQTAQAEFSSAYCNCVLDHPYSDSDCPDEQGKNVVCITKSFIDQVVNPGQSFVLSNSASGVEVRVDSDSFTITGAEWIFFSDEVSEISNQAMALYFQADVGIDFLKTDIGSTALNDYVKSIYIEAGKSVFLKERYFKALEDLEIATETNVHEDTRITFEKSYLRSLGKGGLSKVELTADFIIAGENGIISNQANVGGTGDSGKVIINASKINIGNIATYSTGYNGGDVNIYGERIKVSEIKTYSETLDAFVSGFVAGREGRAGTITIRKSVDEEKIDWLWAGDLKFHGLRPSNLTIKANHFIRTGEIDAFSGCEGFISKCDYCSGGYCLCPDPEPYREYCSSFKPSGSVVLEADGKIDYDKEKEEWKTKINGEWIEGIALGGVWVNGIIDNSANSDHDKVKRDGENWSGAGNVDQIKVQALNGFVHLKEGISAVGFHSSSFLLTVDVKGKYVEIRDDVITKNFNAHVFSEEIDELNSSLPAGEKMEIGTGAGSVSISAEGDLDYSFLLIDDIYAQGDYPLAPDGGSVELVSDWRLSDWVTETYDRTTTSEIITSGAGMLSTYWGSIDGMSINPQNGQPIQRASYSGSQTSNWCDADTSGREYFDGTDGRDGVDGGNGGDITVQAPILKWKSGSFSINSSGGGGFLGGMGGEAFYCENYEGKPTAIVPDSGFGGRGGNGGDAGDIAVQANKLHCLSSVELSSNGGPGARGAYLTRNFHMSTEGSYNEYLGNCSLEGFASVSVPEIESPPEGGGAGQAGTITFSPAPTDDPVDNLYVRAAGGSGGDVGPGLEQEWSAYPSYCEVSLSGNDLISIQIAIEDCVEEATLAYDDHNDGERLEREIADCVYDDEGDGSGVCCKGFSFCYNDEDFARYCRPKFPQTPCQRRGVTLYEEENGMPLSNSSFFFAEENGPVKPYNGPDGSSGSDGGAVTVTTKASEPLFSVTGGSGGGGGNGQVSTIERPGDGGNGGDAGKGGSITAPDYESSTIYNEGGYGGWYGGGGYRTRSLPISNDTSRYNGEFCLHMSPSTYTVPYWDYDDFDENSVDNFWGNTNDDEIQECEYDRFEYCCDFEEELKSCRTLKRDGFDDIPWEYNVTSYSPVGYLENFGNNGNSGKSEAGEFGDVDYVLADEIAQEDIDMGLSCTNPVDIDLPHWKEPDCGDDVCQEGEECGEPGLPDCPAGEGCVDCECVDLCGNGNQDPKEECGEPGLSCSSPGQDCVDCKCLNNAPVAVNLDFEDNTGCWDSEPEVFLSWNYYDPDGDNQKSYEIEIDKDRDFEDVFYSEEIDQEVENKDKEDWSYYKLDDQSFSFGETYYWRIKVKDEEGNWSEEWAYPPNLDEDDFDSPVPDDPPTKSPGESFTVSGEYPKPDFGYSKNDEDSIPCDDSACGSSPCTCGSSPLEIEAGDKITITENTTTNCLNCEYEWSTEKEEWNFIDSSSAIPDPNFHTYSSSIEDTLTLKATTEDRSCKIKLEINPGALTPPEWREISPSW